MNCLVGMVLFNPDIDGLSSNLDNWNNEKVVLIDNASSDIGLIEKVAERRKNVTLIKNNRNMGIACALNQIMKYAAENDVQWVLTLDQDSRFPETGLKYYENYIADDVAILACRIEDINDKEPKGYTEVIESVENCITSGSLNNVEAWKRLGGFDEQLFIDYVDFEYCIRVRKYGYKIIKCNSIVMRHHLGELEIKKFFGRRIYVTNHSPVRCYYLIRNLIYTYRKHREISRHQNIYIRICKQYGKILFFERSKLVKVKAMNKGIYDGLRKKVN